MKKKTIKYFILVGLANTAKSQMLSYSDIVDKQVGSVEGSIVGSLRAMSDENLEILDRTVNLELQRVLFNHVYI